MRLAMLEEENVDLKTKVASLVKANERLKVELVNRSKAEKLQETRKYHDTKYKSKYHKSSTPTKVNLFCMFFLICLAFFCIFVFLHEF